MKTIPKKKIARIEVQQNFCDACGETILYELDEIEGVSNIIVYPTNAVIVFCFSRANELSKALNILTKLGFPEIGDDPILEHKNAHKECNCSTIEYAA